jgi:hypothetical protein
VVGLSTTTIAYVFAYFSQGAFLTTATHQALTQLKIADDPDFAAGEIKKSFIRGNLYIAVAVVLTVFGLGSFLVGSWLAMSALT